MLGFFSDSCVKQLKWKTKTKIEEGLGAFMHKDIYIYIFPENFIANNDNNLPTFFSLRPNMEIKH